MKVKFITALAITAGLLTSGCAAKRVAFNKPEINERYVIYANKENPGEVFVLVKNQHDLDNTLVRLQCKNQPCAIGRLGEVYVVNRAK